MVYVYNPHSCGYKKFISVRYEYVQLYLIVVQVQEILHLVVGQPLLPEEASFVLMVILTCWELAQTDRSDQQTDLVLV